MITIAPSQRMNLADLFANHIGLRDDSVPPVAFLQQAYAQVQWLEQLFAQASE